MYIFVTVEKLIPKHWFYYECGYELSLFGMRVVRDLEAG